MARYTAAEAAKLSEQNQIHFVMELIVDACDMGRRFIIFEDALAADTISELNDLRFETEYFTESDTHKIKW